jgi:predicted ATPase/DNA-binding CsgD family transcriptional regulator
MSSETSVGRALHHGLVGRQAESALLEELLESLGRGQGGCVALVGEPGIGKTVLLRALCRRAEEERVQVAAGRGTEFELEVPFGPFVAALDQPLAQVEPALLGRLGRERLAELASVFPALQDPGEQQPAYLQAERFRLHHAVQAALAEVASERPLALVLDDLHWADQASLELVARLLRGPPQAAVLLALAYRSRQVSPRLSMAVELAEREGRAAVLELRRLSEAQAQTLLPTSMGREARTALYRESGGNPFYLTELARATREGATVSGRLEGIAIEPQEEVPAAVRATVAQELDAASPAAARLAQTAAVAGEPFDPSTVARITGVEEREALEAVDQLARIGLVRATEVLRRFVFRHPIVRRAIYEGTGEGFRIMTHAHAARVLAERDAPLAAQAHHVELSAEVGDGGAVELLTEAGRAATPRAPATAARWFRGALRLGYEDADPAWRLGLLTELATALGASGQVKESREALNEALSLLPPNEPTLKARLLGTMAQLDHMVGQHSQARTLLETALSELGDKRSPASAALTWELAMDAWFSRDWDDMARWATETRGHAQVQGDSALEMAATACLALARCIEGDTATARAHADAAVALAERLTDAELAERVEALFVLGDAETELERPASGARYLERSAAISRAAGQSSWYVSLMCLLALAKTWQGRLGEASDAAEAAIESSLLGHQQPLLWALGIRCWVSTLQGDLETALRAGRQATAMAAPVPISAFIARNSLAGALLAAGDADEARAELLRGGPAPEHEPIREVFRLDVLCEAELACGDVDAAGRSADRLDALAARLHLDGHIGAARRARAAVALARGDHDQAKRLASEAAERFALVDRPIDAARACLLEGVALAGLGETRAALGRVESAHASLEACGAVLYRDQAEAALRRLGRRTPRRPGAAGAALSPREVEVAELVGAGLTNRQIGERLFLSEKTIESRMARIFKKLGVTSRTAVASHVTRTSRDRRGHGSA